MVYESILNQFFNEMTPLTSQKAYMVGPGNHESNCKSIKPTPLFFFPSWQLGIEGDNGGSGDFNLSICVPGQTNFTGYRNHWRMPSLESGGLENFWCSFDHGMVHFVQIDTETDLGHGIFGPDEPNSSDGEDSGPFGLVNQQINWLTKDLSSVDRTLTPWVIVGQFIPPPLFLFFFSLTCVFSRSSPIIH